MKGNLTNWRHESCFMIPNSEQPNSVLRKEDKEHDGHRISWFRGKLLCFVYLHIKCNLRIGSDIVRVNT